MMHASKCAVATKNNNSADKVVKTGRSNWKLKMNWETVRNRQFDRNRWDDKFQFYLHLDPTRTIEKWISFKCDACIRKTKNNIFFFMSLSKVQSNPSALTHKHWFVEYQKLILEQNQVSCLCNVYVDSLIDIAIYCHSYNIVLRSTFVTFSTHSHLIFLASYPRQYIAHNFISCVRRYLRNRQTTETKSQIVDGKMFAKN